MKYLPLFLLILLTSCATVKQSTLTTVPQVELTRYTGKWHEIAAFPAWFQKGCTCTTAEYSILPNGKIRVVNSCVKEGKPKTVEGVAKVVPGSHNARLKVQFQWPFQGNYWIIGLDEKDYQWVVVSEPSRQYLWILSRQPQIPEKLYTELVALAADKGLDISKLVRTNAGCL
jgi:apolipoprotein D and lipocalin family protein